MGSGWLSGDISVARRSTAAWSMGRAAAPEEGLLVRLDGGAVELDRLLDGRGRHRDQPLLIGEAQHEQVGGDGIAAAAGGEPRGVDEVGGARARRRRLIIVLQASRPGKSRSGLRVKSPVVASLRVDHRRGLALLRSWRAPSKLAATTMSQPSSSRAPPAASRTAWMSSGSLGDADMGEDGAALLRQPGHVERRAALALEMRGHAQQRADGDDAGAADAGDRGCHRARVSAGSAGSGSSGERRVAAACALALAQPAAMDGDEARAEALEAGEVLVAGRLVDRALAAELGLDGNRPRGSWRRCRNRRSPRRPAR